MKKLLILLFAAAVIGILMSGSKEGETTLGQGGHTVQKDDTPADGAVAEVDIGPSVSSQPDAEPRPVAPVRPAPKEPAPRSPVGTRLIAGETEEGPDPVRVPEEAAGAMAKAKTLLEAGRRVQARAILSSLYLESRGKQATALRVTLDRINRELVFNPRCTEGAVVYTVVPGDNLTVIARKLKVNLRQIARLNGMKLTDRLRIGRQLKVISGMPAIFVWKKEFRLALFVDGAYIKEYAVGIGREDRTPTGEFEIDNMVVRAPWTAPGGRVIRYGEPGYELGERWLGFKDRPGAAGLGIHGTNQEETVGTKCSNGCLRMRNVDVVELYDFVGHGTIVRILE
jgi:lipoprotein-anchoring transpeptidase ErfK/SrfK